MVRLTYPATCVIMGPYTYQSAHYTDIAVLETLVQQYLVIAVSILELPLCSGLLQSIIKYTHVNSD